MGITFELLKPTHYPNKLCYIQFMKSVELLLIVVFFSLVQFSISQNEASKWYFGNQAGLDFSSTPPSPLNNGVMMSNFGCSSISDSNGNLLFYTNGETIWNQNHVTMANGAGLAGSQYASQSSIIVKQPGQQNIYFVFTQAASAGVNGLRYSIVDMSLSAGNGSVTTKNVLLHSPSTEKLTAVNHCNGADVWIISHDWNSANFRSYLISSSGINTVAVISSIGSIHTASLFPNFPMKASPNGRKLGLALFGQNSQSRFELFDFDNATGSVSNPLLLYPAVLIGMTYGCEFSSDGTKFYGAYDSMLGAINQWNLCLPSDSDIIASNTRVDFSLSNVRTLQLAPDGKIYIAKGWQSLDVINNPNAIGTACNFSYMAQSYGTGTCQLGLPNFVSSYFSQTIPSPSIVCSLVDSCSLAKFEIIPCKNFLKQINSVQWEFGEPLSGANNTSNLYEPLHNYSSPGTYTVRLILNYNCSIDTIYKTLVILGITPTVSVSGNTTICVGETCTLAATGASHYQWQNISNTFSAVVSPSATSVYTLLSFNSDKTCKSRTTVTLSVLTCNNINEFDSRQNLFDIYPNPVEEFLCIQLYNNQLPESRILSIKNTLGECIINYHCINGATNLRVPVKELTTGIYYIELIVKGNSIATKKFIKQ